MSLVRAETGGMVLRPKPPANTFTMSSPTGNNISILSLHQTEGEILFPPGSKFIKGEVEDRNGQKVALEPLTKPPGTVPLFARAPSPDGRRSKNGDCPLLPGGFVRGS